MKKLGVAVVITTAVALTVLGFSKEGQTGVVWKGSDPGPAPPVFFAPETASDQYATDAAARLRVLKDRIDAFARDARKTAEERELAGEVKELKAGMRGLEADLEKIRSSGRQSNEELKAGFNRKLEALELLLNKSAAAIK